MTSMRNNVYYVLFVVPVQTALALGLALVVNGRMLKGKGFFRTAFYFPSVTSSVAISVVFLFIFAAPAWSTRCSASLGVDGPEWFADSARRPAPAARRGRRRLAHRPRTGRHDRSALSWWDWLAGPSVAMCSIITLVVWTTSRHVHADVPRRAAGHRRRRRGGERDRRRGRWQRFRYVTLPMLKPDPLPGAHPRPDRHLAGLRPDLRDEPGRPGEDHADPGVPVLPAPSNNEWGQGSAIAFILFAIIVVLTLLQRFVLRDKDEARARAATRRAAKAGPFRLRPHRGGGPMTRATATTHPAHPGTAAHPKTAAATPTSAAAPAATGDVHTRGTR